MQSVADLDQTYHFDADPDADPDPDFYFMWIRIRLFTLMRIPVYFYSLVISYFPLCVSVPGQKVPERVRGLRGVERPAEASQV
jgi:hypothetical protein